MSSYTIPNVITQHPRGERIMDVYSHLLTERIIYLGTGIDAGVANALIAQLLHLESSNPEADVHLYINCEDGDPSAMLAIYDTMQFVRPKVATTCVGQAVAVGDVAEPLAMLVRAARKHSPRACRHSGSWSRASGLAESSDRTISSMSPALG